MPIVFQRVNEKEIKEKFMEFRNKVNTKIEAWIESGSGIRIKKQKRLM